MSSLISSSGQSTGTSASVSVLPMSIQDQFPLGLTALISLLSRDTQESSPAPQFKSINSSAFFTVQLSHLYMTTGKTTALTTQTFVGKVMSLLSNMLSGLVTAFLPRSRRPLISWLQSHSHCKAQANPNRNWRTHILSLPGDSALGKRETRIHSAAGQRSERSFLGKTADGRQQSQRAVRVGCKSPWCLAAVYGVHAPFQTQSSA